MTELNDPITIIKKTIERKKRKLKTIIVVKRFKHILHHINVNGRIILGSCYNQEDLTNVAIVLFILLFSSPYFITIC